MGSLLPAWCCCKAHMLTGSSLYTSSSSELLYIMITFFGTSCPYLSLGFFLVSMVLLQIWGLCFGLSGLDPGYPPPLSCFLLWSLFSVPLAHMYCWSRRFVSGRGVSKLAVAGVPWVWLTMSWSSNGCSPLLLFDN